MEKLEKYRLIIRQLLTNHARLEANNSDSEIEGQVIFDTEHDHYQLLDIGWDGFPEGDVGYHLPRSSRGCSTQLF
ncbi:MAG: hypothetical protein F6K63_10250 [Moorea sp. SIO1G6]|uniref:element excision factor XisI family protein n=1 Tax=Moorena sp. SIO1G6 TaxID=2607840 RepID=UPI0013BF873E|nr:element excision factor XisI family protein [Moorena sp. SIO1G6]NET64747.1 hypothetical protein [Moorena sp. SIO1G6]